MSVLAASGSGGPASSRSCEDEADIEREADCEEDGREADCEDEGAAREGREQELLGLEPRPPRLAGRLTCLGVAVVDGVEGRDEGEHIMRPSAPSSTS